MLENQEWLSLRPAIPRFLDGVRPSAAVHVGQIEQFAEPAAARTPALWRVVAEVLRVKRLKRAPALWAGPFRRMDRGMPVIIHRKQRSLTQLKRLINKLLPLKVGRVVPSAPGMSSLM